MPFLYNQNQLIVTQQRNLGYFRFEEMPDKFQNKYRITSARLQNWDYGWNAEYFITICTKDREHYFGEIVNGEMRLSEIGELAHKFWMEIPDHFPFIELGNFVVMPNHVHGILVFNKPAAECKNDVAPNKESGNVGSENLKSDNVETRQCLVSTDSDSPDSNFTKPIGQQRYQNQGKNTLSSVIGSYKSAVTKFTRRIHADFAWQTRFHDHIIRNESSFNRISEYIQNNPLNWQNDKFFS